MVTAKAGIRLRARSTSPGKAALRVDVDKTNPCPEQLPCTARCPDKVVLPDRQLPVP